MTRPVRVALVGDVPLDDANAPGSRLLWLARSLRDRGFDVVAGGIRGRGPAPDVPAVALPDPAPATPWGRFFRQHGVALRLLARAPDDGSAARLRAAGADAVVVDGITTALDLAQRAVLLYEPEELDQAATKASGGS